MAAILKVLFFNKEKRVCKEKKYYKMYIIDSWVQHMGFLWSVGISRLALAYSGSQKYVPF